MTAPRTTSGSRTERSTIPRVRAWPAASARPTGDSYDFLIVFTNFDFATGEALAFHSAVRSQVEGIGKTVLDNGDLFGSPGRLHGYVDMAALSRYRLPRRACPRAIPASAPR